MWGSGAGATDGGVVPVVVDAGALALLPTRCAPWVVLTPHAGELARLLTSRGRPVSRSAVEAAPAEHAAEAARLTGATILLKGATTVVVGRGGVLAQADAPAWLATAGAGDVLAGGVALKSTALSPMNGFPSTGSFLALRTSRPVGEPGSAGQGWTTRADTFSEFGEDVVTVVICATLG